jgi:hypothetical protein
MVCYWLDLGNHATGGQSCSDSLADCGHRTENGLHLGNGWEAFLLTLDERFYHQSFLVADVWEKLKAKSYDDSRHQCVLTEAAEELRSALPIQLTSRIDREGAFKQRLGIALAERRGRRFGRVRIERNGKVVEANEIAV